MLVYRQTRQKDVGQAAWSIREWQIGLFHCFNLHNPHFNTTKQQKLQKNGSFVGSSRKKCVQEAKNGVK